MTILAEVDAVSSHAEARLCPRSEERTPLVCTDGLAVDVLPVTAEAIARSELVWPESGFVMNPRGFDLLLHHTRKVSLGANHSIDVATLATIVVLKMASWLDNPSERSRDLQDIGFVLSEYLPLDDERRWEDPQYRASMSRSSRRARWG